MGDNINVGKICGSHKVENVSVTQDLKEVLTGLQELKKLLKDLEAFTEDLGDKILSKAMKRCERAKKIGDQKIKKLSEVARKEINRIRKMKQIPGAPPPPEKRIIRIVLKIWESRETFAEGKKKDKINKDINILKEILRNYRTAEAEVKIIIKDLSLSARGMYRSLDSRKALSWRIGKTIAMVKDEKKKTEAKINAVKKKIIQKINAIRKVRSEIKNWLINRVNAAKTPKATPEIEKRICLAHSPGAKVDIPKVRKAEVKRFLPPWVDFGLTGIFRYGSLLHGSKPGILNSRRGIDAGGVVSARARLTKSISMQVDLKTEEDFEVAGENKADKNVSALDHGRVSLRYDSKKLSALFGLGWIFQESDYPSPVNEDLNTFELEGRINVKPFSKSSLRPLSLNADVSVNIGWVNKTFPINREFTVRPMGRIGASYTMKLGGVKLTPFVWGGAGWYMDREEEMGMVYEGEGGLMLKWNNLETNLIGGYNNVTGIETAIRAFYNDPGWWGVGLQLFFNFISKEQNGTEDDQHIISGTVFARLQVLEKLLGKLALWPYIQAGREMNSGATSILGGIMGRWGLVPARRTEFRPSTDTLPEAR